MYVYAFIINIKGIEEMIKSKKITYFYGLLFTLCFLSLGLQAADEHNNKTITRIYTYAHNINKVIFKFSPSENNSCDRSNYAMIKTDTEAGKQAHASLLSAYAMGKKIHFRGNENNCDDQWGDTMLSIYRIDF